MRKFNLLSVVIALSLFILPSCSDQTSSQKIDRETCFYLLDFSSLDMSQNDKLAELSLNIHDNYWMYKNLDVMPLRFNNQIYMSLNCDRGVEALELDDWMRTMINENAKFVAISEDEYNLMFKKSTSGKIIVE